MRDVISVNKSYGVDDLHPMFFGAGDVRRKCWRLQVMMRRLFVSTCLGVVACGLGTIWGAGPVHSGEPVGPFAFVGTTGNTSSSFPGIGIDRDPGPDPEGFSLADQALSFITGEMHTVINRRLDINKLRVIAGGT